MTNTKALYQGLLSLLDRGQWQDRRHLKTAVSMIVGFILSSSSSLTKWIPYALGRALQAQSVQRRFARWLYNDRLQVHDLYGPLIQEALVAWGEATLYLALDTTMLWGQYLHDSVERDLSGSRRAPELGRPGARQCPGGVPGLSAVTPAGGPVTTSGPTASRVAGRPGLCRCCPDAVVCSLGMGVPAADQA